MNSPNRDRRLRLQMLWPYALLTVALTGGLIAFNRYLVSETPITFSSILASAPTQPPCAPPLAMVGYSITLTPSANAAQASLAGQTNLLMGYAPEFLPVTDSSLALASDPADQALGLDRMWIVQTTTTGSTSQSEILAELRTTPGVVYAEPIWLQSSNPRYLSCDYELQDNKADQALAAIARQALITAGANATVLQVSNAMEFVSLRHFNGRKLFQIAFVYRPEGAPTVAYVALLDPSTRAVLATVRANWYLWG